MQQEGKADHSNLQVYSCKVNYARREHVQGKEIEERWIGLNRECKQWSRFPWRIQKIRVNNNRTLGLQGLTYLPTNL